MKVFEHNSMLGIDIWKEENYEKIKKVEKFWKKMKIEKVIL